MHTEATSGNKTHTDSNSNILESFIIVTYVLKTLYTLYTHTHIHTHTHISNKIKQKQKQKNKYTRSQ